MCRRRRSRRRCVRRARVLSRLWGAEREQRGAARVMTEFHSEPRAAAIVDVGSNSVRLVVYDITAGAITPVLNDRVPAGLGKTLKETGALDPEGIERAVQALKRFRVILDTRGVKQVTAAATAAVRLAADGPEFVANVREILGVKLRVLDGAAESKYSALGVIAAERDARGLIGDLGGTSLEVTTVANRAPGAGVTLRLGPFELGVLTENNQAEAVRRIDDRLRKAKLKPASPGDRLYLVGGAWRNVARIDMWRRGYPMTVLHGYESEIEPFLESLTWIREADQDQLSVIPRVARRRIAALPMAALVLERLIRMVGVEQVVVSGYGLREGLLYAEMKADEQAHDPLLSGCVNAMRTSGGDARFAAALEAWLVRAREIIAPPFGEWRGGVMLGAAARLAECAAGRHTDYRALAAFNLPITAPWVGMSHAERAFLATALHHRYAGDESPHDPDGLSGVMSGAERLAALRLGLALRLACDVSARTAGLLDKTELVREDGVLTARLHGEAGAFRETAEKRMKPLARVLDESWWVDTPAAGAATEVGQS